MLNTISPERVFYLWDYVVTTNKRTEMIQNSSFDEFCDYALDEYIWHNPQYLNDKGSLMNDLQLALDKHKNKEIQDKSIVYVLEEETARDIKIIRALLEKDYEIAVLQYASRAEYVAEKELLNMNIVPVRFGCVWEFMVKSLRHKPSLYFFDAETTFECATVSIQYKNIWGRVVIAPYETFIGSFINISEVIINEEKFCLENADAVVWRYFSKDFWRGRWGTSSRVKVFNCLTIVGV